MMKHVQLSPFRSRADTVSLSSTVSYGSLSPEPLGSRSSSYSSLNESLQTTIKVYARCLRPDIEYKTLSVTFQTSCKEVVATLLGKYKMKHRDPKLFYLSMEVTVRKAGVRTHLALDDEAKPAVLQSCHPKGDSKFSLETRRGGLVRIHDTALNSNSQYKSLLISARTTADETLALLLNCCGSKERLEQFSLYEVDDDKEQQRKLHPDDRPLLVQQTWLPMHRCHFLVRRNPDYMPLSRRKIFWVSDSPPLPASTIFRTSQPPKKTNNTTSITTLSLLQPFPATSEDRIRRDQQQKDETPKQNTICSKQTAVPKNNKLTICNKNSSPSYADYENYFYI